MTFRLRHLLAALALHLVLLAVLAGGVQCSVKPVKPPVITGVLLDPSRQETAKRKREEQRRAEAERKRREEEARRQAEQKQQAEAKRKAQAEADAKKKKEAEALRLKQAAEKKAAEEAARRKREQAEKAEREAAVRRQAEERARVERVMQEEAARREAELAAQAEAEAGRLDKVAEWAYALVRHVQSNYRKPPGAPDDFACQLRMQLLPDGTVTNVRILKSCGDALLDRAVEDAVYRSSPMPRPADPSVFERDLTINFTP
jgi:colicin import membrane protein